VEVIQFFLIGLGTGGLYALTAQGIVLAYRASGTVNFAQGAFGMVSAYVFYELRDAWGLPWQIALVIGVLSGALLGLLTAMLVLRPLRPRAPLVRLMATIGLLIVLAHTFSTKYGTGLRVVKSPLTSGRFTPMDGVSVGLDRVFIFVIAVVLTVVLTVVYSRTRFGMATSAVAENPQAAAALGISANVVDARNWAIAGATGALAGIFIAPISGLQVDVLTFLVLPALAAALVGRFTSFPLTLLGALGLGVAEAEVTRFFPNIGGGKTVSFVIIISVLMFRGTSLPGRNEQSARLGLLSNGRIDPRTLLPGLALVGVLIMVLPVSWLDPFIVSLVLAVIMMSYVVVTGYAGQLSLAQYALAGMGAWFAGRAVANWDLGLELAIPLGVACTIPIGLVVALPALRTRGSNLAVATLGLASILQALVLLNEKRTGGTSGTAVGAPTIFGVDINPFTHPERYALTVFGLLTLVALMVANLRRGITGRRLIAVRSNERAAASVGINVTSSKLYAFGVASAIAALGGILLAFRNSVIVFEQFSITASLTSLASVVIGGVGHVIGPLFGSLIVSGGLGGRPFKNVESVDRWLTVLGGGLLVLMLLLHPTGLADSHIAQLPRRLGRLLLRPFRGWRGVRRVDSVELDEEAVRPRIVTPAALEVSGLTVRFGGVLALHEVALRVEPGQVVGLIGPNGAGKTTFVDAVTGYLPDVQGSVWLAGRSLDRMSAYRRARLGLRRSFQSVELFDDLTIRENLGAATDRHSFGPYVTDLVAPHTPPLSAAAIAAIRHFGLTGELDHLPAQLPFAARRLAGIARSVAAEPSILLLDEPASGLDERESAELGHLIVALAREWGMGVLLIEHDVDLVMRICDRVNVLVAGEIVAEGPPSKIRDDAIVREAYLGIPANDAVGEPEAVAK
jgi:branched-subunit amino acid ABC-type transport system permease component/ABC-type branched-subunit amino acid transport system ATPase component